MLNVLLMLAMHTDVQSRVYDEIVHTAPSTAEFFDLDQIDQMKFMERVIKETMRLFPLSLVMAREALANIKLSKCTVPRGTILFLSVLKMHRNPQLWGPTADQFIPDRFLDEPPPFAYIPFSAGPRNCIGAKYAMISMKIMLCSILTHYKLTTDIKMTDIRMKFEMLLKLENAYIVKLERRQRECDVGVGH